MPFSGENGTNVKMVVLVLKGKMLKACKWWVINLIYSNEVKKNIYIYVLTFFAPSLTASAASITFSHVSLTSLSVLDC